MRSERTKRANPHGPSAASASTPAQGMIREYGDVVKSMLTQEMVGESEITGVDEVVVVVAEPVVVFAY